MLTILRPDLEEVDDAEKLEGRWGVPIAFEMLHERLITMADFFELCMESAQGRVSTSGPSSAR